MRNALSAVLLLACTTMAQAEVWESRDGQCGEFRGRWDVVQEQDGVWVGTIGYAQVGGPCIARTGARLAPHNVEAVIVGDRFYATRWVGDNDVCSYTGQIRRERVSGFYFCQGNANRFEFALRFPPGEDREARERFRGRDQDEWLDNPRTLDRSERDPDYRQEIRPRR